MNPALIWIDIIIVSFVIMVYLANKQSGIEDMRSSYYLWGQGPKK